MLRFLKLEKKKKPLENKYLKALFIRTATLKLFFKEIHNNTVENARFS